MIHDWDLTQTNLRRLREGRYPTTAIIATSAIEPHNLHLPYGVDYFHAAHLSRAATEAAWNAGAPVILLPGIPYGVDCNLMDFPLAMHVSQANLDAMLRDLVTTLKTNGIHRVVIVNGHGGNEFTPFLRQVQADLGVHVFVCHWWRVGMDKYRDIFELPDDHAGEWETSVTMALFPDLVEMAHAKDGAARPFAFEALEKGWVKTSRRFANLNDHCACGDPSKSTPEKGRRWLDLCIRRLTQFLVEVSTAEVGPQFPQR